MPDLPGLDAIAPQEVFAFLLIFARIGAALVTLPGIGEGFVSLRFRLTLGLAIAFLLTPVLSPRLPAVPLEAAPLALLLALETAIGLFVGLAARLLLSGLNVAGNVIAMQSGLGFAINVDPTQGAQGALLATFLVTLAIMLIFAAIERSYALFPPGAAPPLADATELTVRFVSASFALGVALAAPFIAFSLVFYAGLGVVAKLMPQFQVFFVSLPLSIMATFGLLLILLSTMMSIFLDRFGSELGALAR